MTGYTKTGHMVHYDKMSACQDGMWLAGGEVLTSDELQVTILQPRLG